jgi:GntR family transcriptional regulator/MocR family aminotransferase
MHTSNQNGLGWQTALASPKTSQLDISKAIVRSIITGQLAVGEKLPSIRRLATKLNLPPGVVRRAFEHLLAQGWLEMRHGSGTYVSKSSKLLIDQELYCEQNALLPSFSPNANESGLGEQLLSALPEPIEETRLSTWQNQLPYGIGDLIMSGSSTSRGDSINFLPSNVISAKYTGARWDLALERWLADCTKSAPQLTEPAGMLDLRKQIASWLRLSRGITCSPNDVIVVNGAQEARFLLARLFVMEGTQIVFEDPGSLLQRSLLHSFGAKLIPVSMDESGPIAEELDSITDCRLMWTTPTAQFPTGGLYSRIRKQRLLDWANKNDAFIIEDEPCAEFIYQSRMTPAMTAMDENRRTIYIGSFSQVLPAGWQIGFIVVPPAMRVPLIRLKSISNRCTPSTLQWLVMRLFENGFLQQRVRTMQRTCETRRQATLNGIGEWEAQNIMYTPVKAGLFQTIWLPSGIDDLDFKARCQERGVEVAAVSPSYLRGPARSGFVLNFGSLNESAISLGLQRVGAVLASLETANIK